MANPIEQFVDEGLKTYALAKSTLASFEHEVGERLTFAANSRSSWEPLLSHKIKPKTIGDDQGPWISIGIEGNCPSVGDVIIDCGIWWYAAVENGLPIISVSFYQKPKQLLSFPWPENVTIKHFSLWERTFLYFRISNPADINHHVNQLLDALLKQLILK